MPIERKLAAIMFTDIAGYTAQMSKDEAVAISLLNKKESVLKPLIAKHNGTYGKSTGDGSLSHFNSAVDAATCAKRLQESIYDDKDLNELSILPNTNFLVGKTSFVDWVSSIVSLDFLITPEGFPSYIAMSQSIPSLVFYTSSLILLGIHDEWRNSSVFIDVVRHDILSKGQPN